MIIKETAISDVLLIDNYNAEDFRGEFTKILVESELSRRLYEKFEVKEVYYSRSNKNVIRGMHFQLPPYEHNKIVHVIKGKVKDIILDLRKNSNTYGKYIEVDLSEDEKKAIYIPKGCAHGFVSLVDGSCMLYLVSSEYNKEADSGILWNSFGYEWNIENPIISERDKKLISYSEFETPF